ANGVLEGTAPDLTYTPNENFDGSDSFTFTANDGTIDSEAATISITVTPVNDAPVADAGQPQIVVATAIVQLDGSGSTDIDDDPATLTYQWSGGGIELTGVNPTFEYPAGVDSITLTLVVTDSGEASSESQVAITSTPLTATASVAAGVVEATSADGAEVALDGSGSEFPVGAVVRWLEGDEEIASGINPTVVLGLGDHQLTVEIAVGEVVVTDTVEVEVADSTPPVFADGIGVFDFEVEGQVSGVPQNEVLVAVLERVQPLVSDTVDAAPGIGLVDAPDTFPIGTTVLSVEATDQSGNSATAQTSIIVVRSVQQPFFTSIGVDFVVNAFEVLTFDIAVENPDA
ncbi:MAG: Ig-like domain-containing protein, partial [Pseudomonadales bacterium]|nr:Ig-like domain-containing protein [Pseudomonadales bacterium]